MCGIMLFFVIFAKYIFDFNILYVTNQQLIIEMKKQDWILILCVVVVLAPFFVPATGFFDWFNNSTKAHPYIMAFFKFAILATLGEMLALRIRKGVYNEPGFGIVPRMMVWGFLGMCIAMAMTVFKSGTPVFLASVAGCGDLHQCWIQLGQAGHRLCGECADEHNLRTSDDDIPQMH